MAVAYEGCSIEVLRRCDAGAAYGYTGVTPKVDAISIRNADELYAKLPVGAARLEAQLKQASELTVQTNLVGMFDSEMGDVSRSELKGDCARATHIIAGAQVGAYEFFAGKSGTVSGNAGVAGGAGIGAKSEAGRETISKDGNGAACVAARRGNDAPPDGCGALIRLELAPILDGAERDAEGGSTCAATTVPGANGTCVPEGRTDAPELKELASSVAVARAALAADDTKKAMLYTRRALADFAATMQPMGSSASDYAAEAAFISAEAMARKLLRSTPNDSSVAAVQAWAKEQSSWLNVARASYAEVKQYKRVGWDYAAEFGAASLEESFYDSLVSLPAPKELAGDLEIDMYLSALEDAAAPFQDRARVGYRALVDRSKKEGVETEWAHKAARRLYLLGG